MRIRNTNKATERLHNDDYMEPGYFVVFDEEHAEFNVANVKREVGKAMADSDEYPTVERYEKPDNSGESEEDNSE